MSGTLDLVASFCLYVQSENNKSAQANSSLGGQLAKDKSAGKKEEESQKKSAVSKEKKEMVPASPQREPTTLV
jgi:hypothetical protein